MHGPGWGGAPGLSVERAGTAGRPGAAGGGILKGDPAGRRRLRQGPGGAADGWGCGEGAGAGGQGRAGAPRSSSGALGRGHTAVAAQGARRH